MSNSLAISRTSSTQAVRPGSALAAFTPADRDIIRNSICPDASDAELNYFLSVASALQMNPLTREIHLLITENKNRSGQVISRKVNVHAGIDGLRKRAMSSGRIVGIVGPEYANASGQWSQVLPVQSDLVAARVKIYLKDWDFPIEVVAHWEEFGQPNARYYEDGNPKNNWAKMPRWMLGKVALSNGFRAACPDQLAGIYSTEELSAEEIGGYSVTVTDETGTKKSRTVPRPGNSSASITTAGPAADVVDAEVVNDSNEAIAAKMDALKHLLFQVFPDEANEGVNWSSVLAFCSKIDGCGKLGRKYPMLKEWSLSELTTLENAVADEWARKQLEPVPEIPGNEPQESGQTEPAEPSGQPGPGLGDPEIPEASF